MLRSWINERIFFCLSLSLFSKQWVGRTMGNETFSVRHCHGIYDSVDASHLGGEGAYPLHPPPRSAPGADQNTRIVIHVSLTTCKPNP